MKLSCDVIRDILPLYAEDMVCQDTKDLVEEHICQCQPCTKELEILQRKSKIAYTTDDSSFKRVKKIVAEKRVRAVFLTLLILLSTILTAFAVTFFPFYIEQDDAIDSVYVKDDGAVMIKFREGVYHIGIAFDESQQIRHVYAFKNFYTWKTMVERPEYPGGFEYRIGAVDYVKTVCYGWNNELIWGEDQGFHVHSEIAILCCILVFAVIGAVVCLLAYRKKRNSRIGKFLLHLGVFCGAYVLSYLVGFKFDLRVVLLLWGREATEYFLWFIVMALVYYGTAMMIINNKMDLQKL